MDTDQIQEAFEELSLLGAIVSFDTATLTLNLEVLMSIGYVLILYDGQPTFYTKHYLQLINNPIILFERTIPISALQTYISLKLQNCTFSK